MAFGHGRDHWFDLSARPARAATALSKDERKLRGWLVAIVLAHAIVAIWHGAVHLIGPVPLTSLQDAFVTVVIILVPFVGAALLWSRHRREAALVIALSMLASLLFGFMNHFVLDSPDYVGAVPAQAGRWAFIFTAALLAVTETVGVVVGAFAVKKWWPHSSP